MKARRGRSHPAHPLRPFARDSLRIATLQALGRLPRCLTAWTKGLRGGLPPHRSGAAAGSGTSSMAQRVDGNRLGFLAVSFLLVCLVGLFASYATPIPYARGMLREQAL